jgi:phosphoribosylcarboxyaminoimidazole (NCAIR) mutase
MPDWSVKGHKSLKAAIILSAKSGTVGMKKAVCILRDFGVPFGSRILSTHREKVRNDLDQGQ